MSFFVICPSCNEENSGSVILCKNCQTSLVGIPRQEKQENIQEGLLITEEPKSKINTQIINGYESMLKEIRSWGVWSLGLGALHLFTSGFLSAPWGILLILVGIGSFYFQSSSMFVIYAITLSWAALSNLTSFQVGWIGFAVFQFFLVFRIFQQFRQFHNIEKEYNIPANEHSNIIQLQKNRAPKIFPWLSSLFGCSSILALVIIIVAVLVLVIASGEQAEPYIPNYLGFIEGLAVNFGILGVAIGLTSLVSKYDKKILAIIGLVSGVLTILLELALMFL